MSNPPPVDVPVSLKKGPEQTGFFESLVRAVYLIWEKQRGVVNRGEFLDLTISSGAVTITSSLHQLIGEGGVADDLDTINGGIEGDELIIRAKDSAVTITAKDGTGNLALTSDFAMDHNQDVLELIFDGTNWLERSRSSNA